MVKQAFWDGFEKESAARSGKREKSKPMGPGEVRFGNPRTNKEREDRHGSTNLPPRGAGLKK